MGLNISSSEAAAITAGLLKGEINGTQINATSTATVSGSVA